MLLNRFTMKTDYSTLLWLIIERYKY